jgi:hypothetical protein
VPSSLDNGRRSPRKLLRAVVARLLRRKVPRTLWIGVQPGHSGAIPRPFAVFEALRPEAVQLTWVMWGWFDAMGGEPSTKVHLGELADRVYTSPFGVSFSWDALAEVLWDPNLWLDDGNLVGCSDSSLVPRFPDANLQTLHESCEIAVTAFDSTCWFVSAPPSVIERLQHVFPNSRGEGVLEELEEGTFDSARRTLADLGKRLYARVDRERITYKWSPLPEPDLVIVEGRPGGAFLSRFLASGKPGAEEVFSSMSDAQQRAADDYGDALGDWHSIPQDEPDALKYALRALDDA